MQSDSVRVNLKHNQINDKYLKVLVLVLFNKIPENTRFALIFAWKTVTMSSFVRQIPLYKAIR